MSQFPTLGGGGHYDDNGQWVRTKFCFVYCGPDRCNCTPPGGVYNIRDIETPLDPKAPPPSEQGGANG